MASTTPIEVKQATVGATAQIVWFAYVGGQMLRDRRGVGRRFKSEDAARGAALLDVFLREAV